MKNGTDKNSKLIVIIVAAVLVVTFILAFAGKLIYDKIKESKESDYADDYYYITDETTLTEEETESASEIETETSVENESYELNYTTDVETLSEYGECTFEKITFTGTYAGISKINKTVNDEYTEFCNGLEGEEGYNFYAKEATESGSDLSNFSYTWKVSNVWYSDKYVSITFEYYRYAGGAHGDSAEYGYTYDLDTGEKIKLSDISLADSQYDTDSLVKKYITDYFENESTDDEGMPGRALSYDSDDITFFIQDDGLHLFFNPYEITYGTGFTDITIPLTEFELYSDQA